ALHHPGKDKSKGPRGSSALPAGIDTAIEMDRDGDDVTATCRKQKHAPHFDPFTLILKVAPFGELEDSCVLEPAPIKTLPLRLQFKKEQRFDVLAILVRRGEKGATHKELKKSPGIKERNLNRALKFLVEEGFASKPSEQRGGLYRVTPAGNEAHQKVCKQRA